ncbi:MAG: hypothetical protein HFF19_05535 [Oscillospiraceae bacterium]|nr:hypothetical protein [Oscillospiraceae bacterium]
MKRVLSVMLAVCMSFTLCSFSYATDDFSFASEPPVDYGDPIQETTYYDEELDAEVTERIYFAPAESTMFSEKSGEGWYKNEKTYTGWDNGRKSTTYFVEAYFVWGNGDVSISQSRGGHDWHPSNWEVVSEKVTEGTGQYGWVFNKFAYATYKLDLEWIGLTKNFEVTIRLSESGNMI